MLLLTDADISRLLTIQDALIAVEEAARWEAVRELGQMVAGRVPGRLAPDDITLFKSLGIGLWDVAVAGAAYRKAEQLGMGQELP